MSGTSDADGGRRGPDRHRQGSCLVSVGMPVYNGERYLEEALASIRSQTLDDIEIIVSDNASTDRSVEIVRDVAASDPRVKLMQQAENRGAAANYNLVLMESTGRFFRWAPADDRMKPRLLEACARVLLDRPECVLCYPKTQLIDERGEPIAPYEDRLGLDHPDPVERASRFVRNVSLCNAVLGLYSRDVLARSPLIQSFIGSDAVLLFWTALAGRLVEVPERLFERRVHAAASHESAPNRAALRAWFDPGAKSALDRLTPRHRLLLEYCREIVRAEMPAASRARMMAHVLATWTLRRGRIVGGRWKRRVGFGTPLPSDESRFAGRL